MKRLLGYLTLSCSLGIAAGAVAQIPSGTASTELISVDAAGVQGNLRSYQHAITADGRFVVFSSGSTNWIEGADPNAYISNIFLRDRATGAFELISVDNSGVPGDGYSYYPSVSADGRFVAFRSSSKNFVPNPPSYYMSNIFVRDRTAGTTELVSVNSSGIRANGFSMSPDLSAGGRYVAFYSSATNLVPGGDANGSRNDIFVHDRETGETELVSVNSSGVQGNGVSSNPVISADGRFVVFHSQATNLVPGGDANGPYFDVFVRDRINGTTEVVSVDSAGVQANNSSFAASISLDGRFVTFTSRASNLHPGTDVNGTAYDAYVHDRLTGITELVAVNNYGEQGDGYSYPGAVSADGRYVAFFSPSTNLIPGGDVNGTRIDAFLRDRVTGTTELISVNNAGEQSNGWSRTGNRAMSSDARFVAFSSSGTNLIPGGDANYTMDDIFVRDRGSSNSPPVANAGPDRVVACVDPVATDVTLDGSASYDDDGDPLTYSWSSAIAGGGSSNSGVNPTVALPLGASTFDLVVNDGQADSDPDSVTVVVAAQAEGFLTPLPTLVQGPAMPPEAEVAYKAGRTLPLKLKLSCGTRLLTDADIAPPRIASLTWAGFTAEAVPVIELDAGASNDNGAEFRYSPDGFWIFNLSTQPLSVGSYYRIGIQTPDGLFYYANLALK